MASSAVAAIPQMSRLPAKVLSGENDLTSTV
jgi:hypothetical protein